MQRDEIIRCIVERDVGNLGLNEEAVQHEAGELYEAACEHFGTWETALRYAGVSRRNLRSTELSHEDVLSKIRRVCIKGLSLAPLKVRKRDRELHRAAVQHFGNWRNALQAAGIDVKHLPQWTKQVRHDKQEILQALEDRQAADLSMKWSVVCFENLDLATPARNMFHTWRDALLAAGVTTGPAGRRGTGHRPGPPGARWRVGGLCSAAGLGIRRLPHAPEQGALVLSQHSRII